MIRRRKILVLQVCLYHTCGSGNLKACKIYCGALRILSFSDVNPLLQKHTNVRTHIHNADGQKAGILTKLLYDWFMAPKMTAATIDLLSL